MLVDDQIFLRSVAAPDLIFNFLLIIFLYKHRSIVGLICTPSQFRYTSSTKRLFFIDLWRIKFQNYYLQIVHHFLKISLRSRWKHMMLRKKGGLTKQPKLSPKKDWSGRVIEGLFLWKAWPKIGYMSYLIEIIENYRRMCGKLR